jgi:uncharacterized protein (TIGR00369 family)
VAHAALAYRVRMAPAFDPAAYIGSLRAGHIVALGLRYRAHGDGWCELALGYDRRLVSDPVSGILASGPIVSLLDMATTMAIWVKRGGIRPHATLDLRLDYLRPARPGAPVTGHAECYRLTRRVAFVRGLAHDGDPADPVAHLAGTFMLLDAAA